MVVACYMVAELVCVLGIFMWTYLGTLEALVKQRPAFAQDMPALQMWPMGYPSEGLYLVSMFGWQ